MRRGKFGYGHNSVEDEPGDDYALAFVGETNLAWIVVGQNLENVILPKSATSLLKAKPDTGGVLELWVPDWLAEQKDIA